MQKFPNISSRMRAAKACRQPCARLAPALLVCINLWCGPAAPAADPAGGRPLARLVAGRMTSETETPARDREFAAALQAVAGYRFGDSRQALAVVETLVKMGVDQKAVRPAMAAQLAAFLGSGATLEARQFACRQLALVGGAPEVGVLARLLPDAEMTWFARLALERMGNEESRAALAAALADTSGRTRLGIIHSLAVRQSEASVPALGALIGGTDAATAGAAITALGGIGGQAAADLLLSREPALGAELRPVAGEALLRCAGTFLARGGQAQARAILEKLVQPGWPAPLRKAALIQLARTLDAAGGALIAATLAGEDATLQSAAVQALRAPGNPAGLRKAAELLPRLAPELQAQVATLLGENRSAEYLPALARVAASREPVARRAALAALGQAGNASTVPQLAELLAGAADDEKKIIGEALQRLRGEGVELALVAAARQGAPAVSAPCIRALVARECLAAIPAFVELARTGQGEARREAILALGKLGSLDTCPALLELLSQAGAADRNGLETALGNICRRQGQVGPVASALASANEALKISLLNILAQAGGPAALEAICQEAKTGAPEIRATAAGLLAEWPDAAPLDDLATLGTTGAEARTKTLALRGIARLARQAKDRPASQLVELLGRCLEAKPAASEARALLSALGELQTLGALEVAERQLATAGLVEAAAMAMLQIVEAAGRDNPAAAKAAIDKILAASQDPAVAARAKSARLICGGAKNLALGATATSLDGLAPDGQGGGPQAAIDGNPATYWDETDNQKLYHIRVQLARRSRVIGLRILGFQQQAFAPKDFEILCDRRVVRKIEDAQYRTNWLTVELPPTECETVDLKITGYYPASPAIRELEIYGEPINQ